MDYIMPRLLDSKRLHGEYSRSCHADLSSGSYSILIIESVVGIPYPAAATGGLP